MRKQTIINYVCILLPHTHTKQKQKKGEKKKEKTTATEKKKTKNIHMWKLMRRTMKEKIMATFTQRQYYNTLSIIPNQFIAAHM